MSEKKKYDFGEKTKEYSAKHNKELEVWKSPRYEEAKKKVISMLESEQYKNVLTEADFWILMNATKSEKMAYTGLIITHNACLKINDTLPEELKFRPECMSFQSNDNEYNPTYNQSLIFVYDSSKLEKDMQKVFEIGEVSTQNCNNPYPYAMGLKRCMDRVILKNSKLAYSGVYSDSEAEEFAEPLEEKKEEKVMIPATESQCKLIQDLYKDKVEELVAILTNLGKKKVVELTIQEASEIIKKEKK